MRPSKSAKGSYRPSRLNPNRQPSSDSSAAGGVQQPPDPPLISTNPPANHAMSFAMSSSPVSPSTPHYPESSNLLQASSSTNNIGEAFMDDDDDEDDDSPPPIRPPPQPLGKPIPRVQSPPHPATSSSPPSKLSSEFSSNFHPSFNQPRQPSHPSLPQSPLRRGPSLSTLGTRSRPNSYAPSEEVMLGLGLGSRINEMPLNLDKAHHLILYELPPTPLSQKQHPLKVPSFSGSMRGPMAYAYDPSADMNRPVDEEDRLHDPNARGYHDNSFPWRGVINVAALIFMLVGMMALFLFYPIYTHYGDADRQVRIQQIIDTDGIIP